MNDPKNLKETRFLRNKYWISIGLLVLLFMLNQMLVQHSTSLLQENAQLIQLAGKQQVYSQQIPKAAMAVSQAETKEAETRYRNELIDSLQKWEENQRRLQSEYGSIKSIFNLESQLPLRYREIQTFFATMDHAGWQIVNIIDSQKTEETKEKDLKNQLHILQINEPLLRLGMERVTDQYGLETSAVLLGTQRLASGAVAASFFVILMVSLFVFNPALDELERKIREMRETQNNLEALFLTAPSPMILMRKRDNRVLMTNRQAHELFGMVRGAETELNLNCMQMRETPDEPLIDHLLKEEGMEGVETILFRGDGEQLHFHLSSSTIRYQGEKTLIIGLMDITSLKKTKEILKRHASTDYMTGLLNKQYGLQSLRDKLEKSRKEQYSIAVFFMDIDHLKLVNDRYGHEEGDDYIKKMAELLLRNTGMNDVVFRYGGDEMVAVLEDCGRPCGEKVLKRMERSLEQLAEKAEKPYSLHASMGFVVSEEVPDANGEQLLALADQAMYENKKRYKKALGEDAPELR